MAASNTSSNASTEAKKQEGEPRKVDLEDGNALKAALDDCAREVSPLHVLYNLRGL